MSSFAPGRTKTKIVSDHWWHSLTLTCPDSGYNDLIMRVTLAYLPLSQWRAHACVFNNTVFRVRLSMHVYRRGGVTSTRLTDEGGAAQSQLHPF